MAIYKQSVTIPTNFGTQSPLIRTGTTGSLGSPVIYIPENNPSTPVKFTSVMLWASLNNSSSTAVSITRLSASINLEGSATSSQNAGTSTLTNSAEDWAGIFGPFDYTDYFTASFGTVTAKTASVNIAPVLTTAGTGLSASYGWIDLTYEYTSSATRRIKTICVPHESSQTTLSTTLLTAASMSQVTGSGGLLTGYANPVVRYRWLELKGNNNNANTATNYSMSYAFNGVGQTFLPAKPNGQASDTWQAYLVDLSGLSLTASHSLQLANSTATRWANLIINEWITFEYDVAGTTRALNYIEFPVEFDSPLSVLASGIPNKYSKEILIPEPGSIETIRAAVELNYNTNTVTNTLNIKGGNNTTYRAYTNATGFVCGQFGTQHRLDTGSGGLTLTNGVNTITINVSSSAGTPSNITGVVKLLYKSDVAPQGIDNHNKTLSGFFRPLSFTLITPEDRVTDNFNIPESNYYLNTMGLQYHLWTSFATSGQYLPMVLSTQVLPGEGDATGWQSIYEDNNLTDGELTYSAWSVRIGDYFKRYPQYPLSDKLQLGASRIYRTGMGATSFAYGSKWIISYHCLTGSLSGTISNSSGGTVSLQLYQQISGSSNYDLFVSSSRTGNGSYSFTTYNDYTNYYVAAYESSTLKGLSKASSSGAGFDINLSTGGEFFF